jgi:hypothetical protein
VRLLTAAPAATYVSLYWRQMNDSGPLNAVRHAIELQRLPFRVQAIRFPAAFALVTGVQRIPLTMVVDGNGRVAVVAFGLLPEASREEFGSILSQHCGTRLPQRWLFGRQDLLLGDTPGASQ